MLSCCSNLYFLSALACRLTECMEKDELEMLSADLKTLGEMIESAQIRKSVTEKMSAKDCLHTKACQNGERDL